jgi:drug/metabolite transporter (DMT)-like permease
LADGCQRLGALCRIYHLYCIHQFGYSAGKSYIDHLISLGLVGTATPYILLNNGLRHLEASVASIILLLEPIYVVFLQVFLLREAVHWYQALGGAVLLACSYLVQAGSSQNE